jgi:hypothetical protein
LTDKACNSLTLEADAKASKKTDFHVKYFKSQEIKGSKGGSQSLHKTEGKFQFGSKGLTFLSST